MSSSKACYTLLFVITFLLCLSRENAYRVPFNKWVSTATSGIKKSISIVTTAVLICGLPSYSLAEEAPSLMSQLKVIQDAKVASQKSSIELAEQDLQTKELLYPEGRLIGRGIIKLVPESGKRLALNSSPFRSQSDELRRISHLIPFICDL